MRNVNELPIRIFVDSIPHFRQAIDEDATTSALECMSNLRARQRWRFVWLPAEPASFSIFEGNEM